MRPEDDAFEQATDAFTAHRDDWDIVLGSVHTMSDDVSVQDEPVAMLPDDAWADYLGRVTIAAGSGRFDVISHPVRLGYSVSGIPAAVLASPLTVAASIHWLSTCRDAFVFEDCVEDSPLRHELTHEKIQSIIGSDIKVKASDEKAPAERRHGF